MILHQLATAATAALTSGRSKFCVASAVTRLRPLSRGLSSLRETTAASVFRPASDDGEDDDDHMSLCVFSGRALPADRGAAQAGKSHPWSGHMTSQRNTYGDRR